MPIGGSGVWLRFGVRPGHWNELVLELGSRLGLKLSFDWDLSFAFFV